MGGNTSCCASEELGEKCLQVGACKQLVETAVFQEKALDPAVFDEAATAQECRQEPPIQRVIELNVFKSGLQDKLGMDVKHVRGRLVIVEIFPGGAVDRANQFSLCRQPPGDVIAVGDTIVQVNNVNEIDTAILAECQAKAQLRIRTIRRVDR
mmetsp:Transcript_18515/g.36321  ORF Transcript_18515/g.36321 Transcript_18515/m.36321 type:complete len:153 (-) Transcript_18515:58-516(-)